MEDKVPNCAYLHLFLVVVQQMLADHGNSSSNPAQSRVQYHTIYHGLIEDEVPNCAALHLCILASVQQVLADLRNSTLNLTDSVPAVTAVTAISAL